jgi:3-phytase
VFRDLVSAVTIIGGVAVFHTAARVCAQESTVIVAQPTLSTDTVRTSVDDAAIWIHPTDPSKSLLLGTDAGFFGDSSGIHVWNLDGTRQQRIVVNLPQHIDVRYGMQLAGQATDIAVVAMRDHNAIRVYKIDPETRTLANITSGDIISLISMDGTQPYYDPFALGLYKRPSDGTIFAFVTSRSSEFRAGVMQLRLEDDGNGLVKGTQLRIIGANKTEVSGIVVDDALGFLYLAEEDSGVHKHYADPSLSSDPLAFFAEDDGITGNRRGLALYTCGDSTGYLLLSNPGSASIKVYRREGDGGDPHRHDLLASIENANGNYGSGIEVVSFFDSTNYSDGLLMWQSQSENRFDVFDWKDIADNTLTVCPRDGPTSVDYGATSLLPDGVTVMSNYPNPFNPDTMIRFTLRTRKRVVVQVYDLAGKRLQVLLDAVVEPGYHSVRWNGRDDEGTSVASGIYFYQMIGDGFSETRPMVLLR